MPHRTKKNISCSALVPFEINAREHYEQNGVYKINTPYRHKLFQKCCFL